MELEFLPRGRKQSFGLGEGVAGTAGELPRPLERRLVHLGIGDNLVHETPLQGLGRSESAWREQQHRPQLLLGGSMRHCRGCSDCWLQAMPKGSQAPPADLPT